MWRVTTRFSGTLITGGGINRLYFDSTVFSAANAENATFVFWNGLRPVMSDSVTFTTDAVVDTVDPANGDITGQVTTTSHSFAGTTAAQVLSKATQGIVQARSGSFIGGREVRGRVFVPGPTTTASVGGTPTAAYIAALAAAGAALIADVNSTWQIWHRPIKDAEGNILVPGSAFAVQAAGSPAKFGVLRSRRD